MSSHGPIHSLASIRMLPASLEHGRLVLPPRSNHPTLIRPVHMGGLEQFRLATECGGSNPAASATQSVSRTLVRVAQDPRLERHLIGVSVRSCSRSAEFLRTLSVAHN